MTTDQAAVPMVVEFEDDMGNPIEFNLKGRDYDDAITVSSTCIEVKPDEPYSHLFKMLGSIAKIHLGATAIKVYTFDTRGEEPVVKDTEVPDTSKMFRKTTIKDIRIAWALKAADTFVEDHNCDTVLRTVIARKLRDVMKVRLNVAIKQLGPIKLLVTEDILQGYSV